VNNGTFTKLSRLFFVFNNLYGDAGLHAEAAGETAANLRMVIQWGLASLHPLAILQNRAK